jgi:uncharacterized protein YprB with RNaseH-like and TPR domain
MQAVLARTAKREARPPRALDAPELPFITRETPLGPLHQRLSRLSPAHRMGRVPTWPSREAKSEILALLALDPGLAGCDPSRALYLDTETTGLAGGAGTVAFLVGLAWWDDASDPPALVMEQLLVRNLGEEAPMLAHVAERIRGASMLVSFNGKAFDMPLLRARFVMARMEAPREPPHLDLVHVARRLHKPRGLACKLTSLERGLLGFERHDDVPSSDVSACYLHFLRTGDTKALLGVVEHNAWDVLAMAALVGLYGEPLEGTQLGADDLAGVARTLKRAGRVEEAFLVADRAARESTLALRARAEIAKARGDRARALLDFEALAEKAEEEALPAVRLELAKLYEHFVKEHARALDVVLAGTAEAPEASLRRAHRIRAKIEKKRQEDLFGKRRAR